MILNKILKNFCNKNYISIKNKIEKLPQISVSPDDYTILEQPKLFKKRVLELILSSKKRICISALYLQNDEFGNEFIKAIYSAMRANPKLHVRIYVDFHRAQRGLHGVENQIVNTDWYYSLCKKNDKNPSIYGVPVKKREIFGVLHLKGFVFDDTVLYSGASINNVYFNHLENYRIDRYHEILSPELADCMCNYCTEAFHQSNAVQDITTNSIPSAKEISAEIKKNRKILCNCKYKFISQKIQNNSVGLTPLVGLGGNNNKLNQTILNLIDCANKEIFICTPYFNLPAPVLKKIRNALKRNIQITIIIGDKTANDFYIRDKSKFNKVGAIPYIYEMNLKDFIESNSRYLKSGQLQVNLWKNENNTYHVKGLMIDNKYHLITGNNINPRAWALDLENGILIHDKNMLLLEKFSHEKLFLLRHTTRINNAGQLDSFNDYPEEVKKLILKVKKFGAQWLLRKLL